MSFHLSAALVGMVSLAGCGGAVAASDAEPSGPESDSALGSDGASSSPQGSAGDADPTAEAIVVPAPSAKEARGLKRLRVLERGAEMPAFRLQVDGGNVIDSSKLVGREPFLVVFFTSWCPTCERKMPVVRGALESVGGELFAIGVGMDEDDTWKNVAPWIERHGLPLRPVRGLASGDFVGALDPGGSFPVIYVVGRDGKVVDVQIGIQPDHGPRLEQALRLAKRQQ